QVFYLRPLVHSAVENPDDVQSWRSCVKDAVWLRNQVVVPVMEELVFRVALLPVLMPSLIIFHTHFHMNPLSFPDYSLSCFFPGMQFLYTTVFGAFAAFIFLRTGHVVAQVLCHSFCNSQGLPDLTSTLNDPHRSVLLLFYLMGVVLFLLLLFPLTDPFFYGTIPVSSLASLPLSEC
uniref:CAAX prenyl protease 2 n=1 Tax=Kryptolebias marmoratus TaxID=37003 RepID=A0A3Q3A495_KRYMA